MESEREEPANLLGHDPMRRQLAARHRDETVRVPEYRMIPGSVRFRFLRSAFSEEGTQACEGAYNVGRAQMGVREGRIHRLQEIGNVFGVPDDPVRGHPRTLAAAV